MTPDAFAVLPETDAVAQYVACRLPPENFSKFPLRYKAGETQD